MAAIAYFVATSTDTFEPTPAAGGHWGESLISGPAVAGLAAWALERDYGMPGFLPTRFTVDLVRPAHQVPCRVQTRLIRDGRRVRFIDCDVLQGDSLVARASAVYYRQSESPPGSEWTPTAKFSAPEGAYGDGLLVGSDGAGWGVLGAEHQNTSLKRAYYRGADVVTGEPVTPFVRSVIVAEAAANMVVNMGTAGIGYINGDLTLGLSRLPNSEFIGVQGDSRSAADGVAVGTVSLFDSAGSIGTALITSLANPAVQIDFTGSPRTAAPGAELFSDDQSVHPR